jgi:toxin ParE1/3/4
MRDLLTFPHRGQPRNDLAPGLRALVVDAHVNYDRVGEHEITILRILHGSMDAAAHLTP